MPQHRFSFVQALAALTAAASGSLAMQQGGPDYSIPWYNIGSGGGTSSAGPYTLSGTIGQHEASGPSEAGPYTLTGGFWAGVAPSSPGCSPADLAEPFGVLNFFDVAAYIALYNAGDPAADFTGDGQLNFFDVAEFIAIYNQGCP
ncbi:MAG: hypothetical protein LAT64_10885 [Phycisphaerales bacterium]|nr:hypothetical protein [Planctomycetota bacterium]MCH8509255.1 hypothetical protein [Phycisphaerales bacterium]